jgi:hypothetical protein
MGGPELEFSVPGCGWVYPNADQLGYYELALGGSALQRLLPVFGTALTRSERAGLLANQWNAFRLGTGSLQGWAAVAWRLQQETSPAILGLLLDELHQLQPWVGRWERRSFERRVRDLLTPTQRRLGWERHAGEVEDVAQLRARLLQSVTLLTRAPELEAAALTRVMAYLRGGRAIDPALLETELRLAARSGDLPLLELYLHHARFRASATQRRYFERALSSFERKRPVERVRELIEQNALPKGEAGWIVADWLQNPRLRHSALVWLKARSAVLELLFSGDDWQRVADAAATTCMEGDVERFDALFSGVAQLSLDPEALKASRASLLACDAFRARASAPLKRWLRGAMPETPSPAP